jgi:hypothetical protein
VNNCVGLENQRFYLLFILYSLMGVSYHLFTSASIWNHYTYKQHAHLMNFLFITDCVLFLILSILNMWHWTLAMTGVTTVDVLCGSNEPRSSQSSSEKKQRLSFKRVSDNLFRVFGTHSFIGILSPSLRAMPFSGVEWTFQARDLGFMEEIDSDEEHEEAPVKQSNPEDDYRVELEMSDLSTLTRVNQTHHNYSGKEDSSLDSILEDNEIAI